MAARPAPPAAPDVVAPPAATPAPASSTTGAARNPLFAGVRPAPSPAPQARPAASDNQAAAAAPQADPRPFEFAPVRPDNFWAPPQVQIPTGVDPQRAVDTVVGAVTGTAGWVGNGVFDILAAMIVAQGNGGVRPPSPEATLAALLLPAVTGAPGLPPPPDWTRIPPPNLDFLRNIPPPQLPPPPNLDFLRNIPPPQPIGPPNLDFLRSIPPPQPIGPPNLDFLRSIPPPQLPHF